MESIYYVPLDQQRWTGHGQDAVQELFKLGIPADLYQGRELRELEVEAARLPDCEVDFDQKFGGLFVVEATTRDLIPNQPGQALCPNCEHDLLEAMYDVLNGETDANDDARIVTCEPCNQQFSLAELRFTPDVTFARVYLCVTEIDEWPAGFHALVERALGPCRSYREWST